MIQKPFRYLRSDRGLSVLTVVLTVAVLGWYYRSHKVGSAESGAKAIHRVLLISALPHATVVYYFVNFDFQSGLFNQKLLAKSIRC